MAAGKKTPGQNVHVDYAALKPARVRYTSKWPKYKAGKYFFVECPCCGATILFQTEIPRRSDIVNPDDVPAAEMPKGDDCFWVSDYGNPVSRCKKCGQLFFNQYVYEAQHFRSARRGFLNTMRKARVPGLVLAGLFFVFIIADATGFRDWNLLDLLSSHASENQLAFLKKVLASIIYALMIIGVCLAYAITDYLSDTWGQKGLRVNARDPEYLKFLLRIGHHVPQQYLDILKEPPEDADKVPVRERNFIDLSSGRRLYRKRNGHCSCCGCALDNILGFPALLGNAVRVCPSCKNEYFDADFLELSRETYPEKTYARIRRECIERRKGIRFMLGYISFIMAGMYFVMIENMVFHSDRYPLFSADPPYNEITAASSTALLIFGFWVVWILKRDVFKAFWESAYPKSKFQEHLKESENRLRDRHYAECYDLGRKMFSGKEAPEADADKSGGV